MIECSGTENKNTIECGNKVEPKCVALRHEYKALLDILQHLLGHACEWRNLLVYMNGRKRERDMRKKGAMEDWRPHSWYTHHRTHAPIIYIILYVSLADHIPLSSRPSAFSTTQSSTSMSRVTDF